MRHINRTIVAAYLYSKDNKLLMGRRDPSKGGVYPDCWHIPGGGIDDGETKEEALIREVKEEVNLDISPYTIEFLSDDYSDTTEKILKDTGERVKVTMAFNNYKVVISDKNNTDIKVVPTEEFVELRWFDIAELSTLKLTPPGKRYFRKIGYIK